MDFANTMKKNNADIMKDSNIIKEVEEVNNDVHDDNNLNHVVVSRHNPRKSTMVPFETWKSKYSQQLIKIREIMLYHLVLYHPEIELDYLNSNAFNSDLNDFIYESSSGHVSTYL
tara:strand:+ start:207 stop:551 length:345 start_codon:yes stop_codon:yes gene_type:complete